MAGLNLTGLSEDHPAVFKSLNLFISSGVSLLIIGNVVSFVHLTTKRPLRSNYCILTKK